MHVCTHGISLHACVHSWDMSIYAFYFNDTYTAFKYVYLLSHACVHVCTHGICLCILFEWRVLLSSTYTYSLMHVCTHGIAEKIHAGSLSIWPQFVRSCVKWEWVDSPSEHVKSLVIHISGTHHKVTLPQFTNTLAESSRKGVWCFEAKQDRHSPKG